MNANEWRDKFLKWTKEDDRLKRLPYVFMDALAQRVAWQEFDNAKQSVHLTAYRRWLAVSIFVNIVLLLVVASTFGGR